MNLLQSPSLAQVPPHLLGEIAQFTQQHIQMHMQMMQMIMGALEKGKSGKGEPKGNQSGNRGQLQGPNSEPGMEQVPGPLGDALNTKREGEGGGNTQTGNI
jgi:hypothetical protein